MIPTHDGARPPDTDAELSDHVTDEIDTCRRELVRLRSVVIHHCPSRRRPRTLAKIELADLALVEARRSVKDRP